MGLLSQLTLLIAAATAVTADIAAPAGGTPQITGISYSGNGCKQNPKFSGNFNDPTLTFHNFAASLPGSNRTVNCQVHLQATGANPGWQAAIRSNIVKGHVVLEPGTALTYYTTIFFSQDAGATVSFSGFLAP